MAPRGRMLSSMGPMKRNVVLVTSTSSGIGQALALDGAAAGRMLHLSGRNAARLAETACTARGASVRTRVLASGNAVLHLAGLQSGTIPVTT